ncbi:low temperature requirement protein A [Lactiplantibacillus carotarum]|uniref:low temperature requirement protein A n=1 Tax=Lactiplantibacillus carotarum TaxID=2993456 RepID=UPI00298F1B55|nr:low temperature requirement protein A [Lactiplantibacillus carotarum]
MKRKVNWGVPRKITQQISERKISWLELFSDLVYVVMIHSLTVGLEKHLNFKGFITFLVLFYLIFNSWNNLAIYFDLHGNDSFRNAFLSMAQVILVALLAGTVSSAFQQKYAVTALVYLAIQGLFMYMWWTTARYDPEHMQTTRPYLVYYAIGCLLLVLVATIQQPVIQIGGLMLVALLDFSALLLESRNFNAEFNSRKIDFRISASLLERYGQFTMIVLGESLANLIEIFDKGLDLQRIGYFLLLVISTIALWWLYYSLMDDVKVEAANYQGLVLFRGLHINFILALTLECFFLAELAHSTTPLIKLGYLISLVLVLLLLTLMVVPHQAHPLPKRNLWLNGSLAFSVILISWFLPEVFMLLVIDVVLIISCVYRELNGKHQIEN